MLLNVGIASGFTLLNKALEVIAKQKKISYASIITIVDIVLSDDPDIYTEAIKLKALRIFAKHLPHLSVREQRALKDCIGTDFEFLEVQDQQLERLLLRVDNKLKNI